jgi:hypothetical protein
MTQDEIIEMVRKAGGIDLTNTRANVTTWIGTGTSDFLDAFAKLVAAAEREACALIAETPISGEQDDITMEAKDRVAKAIRSRGDEA